MHFPQMLGDDNLILEDLAADTAPDLLIIHVVCQQVLFRIALGCQLLGTQCAGPGWVVRVVVVHHISFHVI